ncbi:MAG: LuxR family transcriptional regulator [SAR324 cluster bacterium]|nr:LuxR family transcriptional regulator [SAR324 cluster bacterium]
MINRTNDIHWEQQIWKLFIGVILVFGMLMLDLILDYFDWYTVFHVLGEILAIVGLMIMMVYMIILLSKSQIEIQIWKKQAHQAEEEVLRWRKETETILRGLGTAIDKQFMEWRMTPAEKEIGLLMLKGLSFKEIASIRQVNERTVRQQATLIYKKSGMGSRSEFSAFFLEDLLLPSA